MEGIFAESLKDLMGGSSHFFITYYDNSCVSSFITQTDPMPYYEIENIIKNNILCSCFPLEHQCLIIYHKSQKAYYNLLKFFKDYDDNKLSNTDFYDSLFTCIINNGCNAEEEYEPEIIKYFLTKILN